MEERYISPWIYTTNKCNLNCPYCYVKRDNNDSMSMIVWQNVINTFNNLLEREQLDAVYYRLAGGEPMLAIDTWFPFMKSLDREKNSVNLITNMTILGLKKLSALQHLNPSFGISLDGFSFSKPDYDGKSTADLVKKNIDALLYFKLNDIDISTVITKNSFDDIDKLAEWIAERNISWGIYLDHYFCGEMDSDIVVQKIVQVINILKNKNYDLLNKFKFSNIKLDGKFEGCTAGKKLIAIDVYGKVFPCQTMIYQDPICDINTTTDLIKELQKQKRYCVGYNLQIAEDCKNCSIYDLCGGGCKLHHGETNRVHTCSIIKRVICHLMKAIIEKEN